MAVEDPDLEFSRFNNRIERHVDALEKALDTGSPKVTLILALVTGTELHPDIQSLLNHEVGKRNWAEEMVDYKVVDLRDLYREILGEHVGPFFECRKLSRRTIRPRPPPVPENPDRRCSSLPRIRADYQCGGRGRK